MLAKFRAALDRRERIKLLAVFHRKLIPPRTPGRPLRENVSAALLDWKAGMHGPEFYQKHIRGWEKQNNYRRRYEARALWNAIHARVRRERKRKRESERDVVDAHE